MVNVQISNVNLQVPDLERSKKFYCDLLGFHAVRKENTLGLYAKKDHPPLLVLTENKNAVQKSQWSTGLFHVAILFPNRKELARIFKRLYENQWQFQGFADHGVSEALYLADPDGNGIELYADRPREQWKRENGEIVMFTKSLDLENLLLELPDEPDIWAGISEATTIGHIHLQVSDLAKAEQFYQHILGFEVTARSYPGALFLAADGYHHHVGLNTWNSRGASSPPPDAVGLLSYGISIRDTGAKAAILERVHRANITMKEQGKDVLIQDQDGIKIFIS